MFLLFLNSSFATEKLLANITSDVLSDYYHLSVNINDENQNLNMFYFDTYVNDTFNKRDEITINDFIKQGIRIPANGKIVVVRISGYNFDEEQGGMLILNTLANILSGRRKTYELHLARDIDQWALYKNGKTITKIKVMANRIPIVGVVGIKDLMME